MKALLFTLLLITSVALAQTPLSDGKTFTGWEGNTSTQWRIEDGAFTSGSLEKKQTRNDYLTTTQEFGDFELTLKWKLQGTEGFVNGGVQFRSKRLAPPSHEVSGFQADLGMGYDGALYDHIRRSKVIQRPTKEVLEKARKPVGEWNDYRIRAEGPRIQIWLNGVQTVDYTETDPTVETTGIIAVQIHGNSTAIVRYKDIAITDLTAGHAIEPAAKVMLFDGKTLDGWIPFSPEIGKSKDDNSNGAKVWSVRDGVIWNATPALANLLGLAKGKDSHYKHKLITLKLPEPRHPIMLGLPDTFTLADECFWSLQGDRSKITALATSDETVSDKVSAEPIIWAHQHGKGRVVASTLGHFDWTFDDPFFRTILLRGIAWAADESPYRFDSLILRGIPLKD